MKFFRFKFPQALTTQIIWVIKERLAPVESKSEPSFSPDGEKARFAIYVSKTSK